MKTTMLIVIAITVNFTDNNQRCPRRWNAEGQSTGPVTEVAMDISSLPQIEGVEYRRIPGRDGYVGSNATIFDLRKGCLVQLRPRVTDDSLSIDLRFEGTSRFTASTVLAVMREVFYGDPPSPHYGLKFLDGDRKNLAVTNVSYVHADAIAPLSLLPNHPEIEYRRIVGWAPGYAVGTDGSIWSCWRPGIGPTCQWSRLKPFPNPKKYLHVRIGPDTLAVHRLVLTMFVGPRPEGKEGAHGDGNKNNNALSNLRWATPLENSEDRAKHGNWKPFYGLDHPGCKTTVQDIEIIRKLHSEGKIPAEIARTTGLPYKRVWCILNNESYDSWDQSRAS